MEEAVLVEKLRNKDPDAINLLYGEYSDRVHAVVRRYIRDEWDAEEVVQDVFWTVHRKIHLFREDSKLWSWMYRIAANAAKMRLRKYKRYPIPMEDDILTDVYSKVNGDDPQARPDNQLICKRIVVEMQAYLDECTDKNHDLYVQMEVNGKSKEEVAELLELSVPAVKTRLHRVRVGLRERIAHLYEQESV